VKVSSTKGGINGGTVALAVPIVVEVTSSLVKKEILLGRMNYE
jgi:hypothetical protein